MSLRNVGRGNKQEITIAINRWLRRRSTNVLISVLEVELGRSDHGNPGHSEVGVGELGIRTQGMQASTWLTVGLDARCGPYVVVGEVSLAK
jgi:hypothetical protein